MEAKEEGRITAGKQDYVALHKKCMAGNLVIENGGAGNRTPDVAHNSHFRAVHYPRFSAPFWAATGIIPGRETMRCCCPKIILRWQHGKSLSSSLPITSSDSFERGSMDITRKLKCGIPRPITTKSRGYYVEARLLLAANN